MNIILVDDEKWAIDQFELECQGIPNVDVVGKFDDPNEALKFVKQSRVEAAFLDVEMPKMNGIELGRRLKELQPEIVIIYITGYSEYINEAILSVKADYYILKPYNREDIEEIMVRATLLCARQKKALSIQTFGHFNVFYKGQIIHFTNAKAKELLALCVDIQGGTLTMERAISILWEDREYDAKVKSLYRKAVIYLNSLFREYNEFKIFENNRGACHINKEEVTCDYFDYLDGKITLGHEFTGEYMYDYSWAEETNAYLYVNSQKKSTKVALW